MAQRQQRSERYTRYTAGPLRATRSPRWLRVLKLFVLAVVICIAFAGGAAMSWLQHTAAQVAHNNPVEVKAASKQLVAASPSHPVNILVIGSDRRVGQPDVGARSDTLIVVRLDPEAKTISMLSVPRDLLVTIPGYGQNKINAAYSFGGAKLAVQTVRQLLGIPINHFIDVGFSGFTDVVNKLGGAYLMIDTRYYNNTATDNWASIDIQPGYQLLRRRPDPRLRALPSRSERRLHAHRAPADVPARDEARARRLGQPGGLAAVAVRGHHHVALRRLRHRQSGQALLAGLLVTQVNTTHIYQTHIEGSTPMINGISYVSATPQQISTALAQFTNPERTSRRDAAQARGAAARPRQGERHGAEWFGPERSRRQCRLAAEGRGLERDRGRQRRKLHLHGNDGQLRPFVADRRTPPGGVAGPGPGTRARFDRRRRPPHRDGGLVVFGSARHAADLHGVELSAGARENHVRPRPVADAAAAGRPFALCADRVVGQSSPTTSFARTG